MVLGTWFGQEGREVYKTLNWEEGEKDNPDSSRKVRAVCACNLDQKNKRGARFRFYQRKKKEGKNFDNFLKNL